MAWRHGTKYAYQEKGCRCDACRTAYSEVQKPYRRAFRERHLEDERERRRSYKLICPDCYGDMSGGNGAKKDPARCLDCERKRMEANRLPCGTRASYARGCRCRPCTDAAVAYQRQFRKPKAAA